MIEITSLLKYIGFGVAHTNKVVDPNFLKHTRAPAQHPAKASSSEGFLRTYNTRLVLRLSFDLSID